MSAMYNQLRVAIEKGDVEAVDRALQSGVSPNDVRIVDGDSEGTITPLYLAAKVRVGFEFHFHFIFSFSVFVFAKLWLNANAIARTKRCGYIVD